MNLRKKGAPQPEPVRAPSVSLSHYTISEVHQVVADVTQIPENELCTWLIIAVRHQNLDKPCSLTGHAPVMMPAHTDHLEVLADLAERAAPRLRAAVHIDIHDAPPMV